MAFEVTEGFESQNNLHECPDVRSGSEAIKVGVMILYTRA